MNDWVALFVSNRCMILDEAILAAHRRGLKVAVIGRAGPCCESGVDRFIPLPDPETDRAVLNVIDYLNDLGPRAVLAYDENNVVIASQVAEHFGLPFVSSVAAQCARNKWAMKQRFRAAGVPCADARLFAFNANLTAVSREMHYPVVVKPIFGAGSQGVIRANDASSFRSAFQYVTRIVTEHQVRPKEDALRDSLIVEQYLEGDEFSVEVLVTSDGPQVLAIFDKPEPLVGPYFEETIYVTPSNLPPPAVSKLVGTAISAIAAVGIESGPCHCELRICDGKAYILEVAARPIGGMCSRVFNEGLGFNLHDAILATSLGECVQCSVKRDTSAGAMMLPIPGEGIITKISGVSEAKAIPGIRSVSLRVKEGDAVLAFPQPDCYIGLVLAVGANRSEVVAALKNAQSTIRFDVRSNTKGEENQWRQENKCLQPR